MKRFFTLLSIGYICTLILVLAIDQTSRTEFPLLALLTTFSIFLFSPLIAVGIGATWYRSFVLVGCFIIGLTLFFVAHPLFPQQTLFAKSSESLSFEAMTFNTGFNVNSAEEIEQLLSRQTADFIGLQEASPLEIRQFDQHLRAQYPYQAFDRDGNGIGVLSRHPIIAEEWLYPPTNGRPILHTELDIDGERLHLFVAHTQLPAIHNSSALGVPKGLSEYWQAREIYFLQEQAKMIDGPVVLMGDFNMSDQSHTYKELSAAYGDAFRDGGWGLGFTYPHQVTYDHKGLGVNVPLPKPLVRIDYVFYDRRLHIQNVDVVCYRDRSDHCAVHANFVMP